MRKLSAGLVCGVATAALLYAGSGVASDNEGDKAKARLDGYQEVPSLSTPGTGKFSAKIDSAAQRIDYTLSFSGLEAAAVAAHIHLGARATTGGVIAFLCSGGNKPVCPAAGGTVTGVITPSDIIGPAAQGIAAGEFAEVVRAIRSGAVYANVHSTLRPSGEIRGQVRADDDD